MANPFTATITGLSSLPSLNKLVRTLSGADALPTVPRSTDSFMSSPAQKARPVPVSMATSSSELASNSSQACFSPVRNSVPSAFNRSGRFIRITMIPSPRSISTTLMNWLPSDRPCGPVRWAPPAQLNGALRPVRNV
jgi:hypothetical protein